MLVEVDVEVLVEALLELLLLVAGGLVDVEVTWVVAEVSRFVKLTFPACGCISLNTLAIPSAETT